VPNRLNYILWAQALLDTTSSTFSDRYDPTREVIALDIGTGASAIYPLLGCATRDNWRFAGTDIDDLSLNYAAQNIKANNLTQRIRLLKTSPNELLIPLDKLGLEAIDITLSNPPFYATASSLLESSTLKSRPPNSACTGSESEMVTPGGEVQFVTRQITSSLILQERVQWYSSMLGKLSSLRPLVVLLKQHSISNYAITEFVQGNKTRRWALAWSFQDLRPDLETSRGVSGHGVPKELLPFPSEFNWTIAAKWEPTAVLARTVEKLKAVMEELPLQWRWKESLFTGVGFSSGDVWSRAARRKQLHKKDTEEGDEDQIGEDVDEMAFGFKVIALLVEGNDPVVESGVKVTIRWLKGLDSVIFEGFCGMLRRKLES
jgi:23S rRNA (adenine1618-N6)-methyltransferase